MKMHLGKLLIMTALTFAIACGDDDQSVNSGVDKPDAATTDTTAPQDSETQDATPDSTDDSAVPDDSATEDTAPDATEDSDTPDTPIEGKTIKVVFNEIDHVVGLNNVPVSQYKDVDSYTLSDIWAQTGIKMSHTMLKFDFETDGFKSSSKTPCKDFAPGDKLDKAYLGVQSGNLVWDDTLGLPGCFNVKGLHTMYAISVE